MKQRVRLHPAKLATYKRKRPKEWSKPRKSQQKKISAALVVIGVLASEAGKCKRKKIRDSLCFQRATEARQHVAGESLA